MGVCVSVCVCVCVCLGVSGCVWVWVWVFVFVFVCVCGWVCIMCIHVCMGVCMYMHARVPCVCEERRKCKGTVHVYVSIHVLIRMPPSLCTVLEAS